MEDVDHDALWRALLIGVWQRGAHTLNCSVTECVGKVNLKHTDVFVKDESERSFIEMSLVELGNIERANFARTVCQPIEVWEGMCSANSERTQASPMRLPREACFTVTLLPCLNAPCH